MKLSSIIRIGWIIALLAALTLMAANLILGDLNQDEGWYLYAARLVAEGKLPYRDFAYTQGPLLPLVYAPARPLIAAWGLGAGRLVTTMLGLGSALLAACLASRLAPRGMARATALLAFTLAAVNVYQSYYTTVVKTYSLTALLITGGFLALHTALRRQSGRPAWLAGILMALAAATRSSAAPALLLTLIVLWVGRKAGPRLWIHFAAAGLLTSIAVFLPFLAMAPESFWFHVVRYHTMREPGAWAMVYKIGFLSRTIQAYFVPTVLACLCFIRPRKSATDEALQPAAVLTGRAIWLTLPCITLLHLAAPFPYDDYQVFIFPLAAAGLAALAMRRLADSRAGATRLALMWLLLCGLAAVSSPLNQEWVIQGRDRIWWRIKDTPPLFKLHAAGRLISSLTQPGDPLLTQDPYLAVEADRRLPYGLELGQFCYFPEMARERAEKLHVMNRDMMTELLSDCRAPLAALSGYAFAMEAPWIRPTTEQDQEIFNELIDRHYNPLMEIHDFGQAATTLRILIRRRNHAREDQTP
ncbi:MAG: ArnT family glycosyltransferase [Kiritimatiellia bacterium]